MVARDHQPAAAPAEPRDGGAILGRQPIAGIDREQPELAEAGFVDRGKHRIRIAHRVTIARDDFEQHLAAVAAEPRQIVPQETEPADVPVVLRERTRGLEQDPDGIFHGGPPVGALPAGRA